jgi:hypothetical protein
LSWEKLLCSSRIERESEREKSIKWLRIGNLAHTVISEYIAGTKATFTVPMPLTIDKGLFSEDPRVYIEILDKRRTMNPATPFLLHNQSGSVAHGIQIQPIKLTTGTAEFKEVDFLGAGDRKEILPEISKTTVMSRHNAYNLFLKEWNAGNDLSVREFVIPATATYTDFSGKARFQVSFDIVYLPINDILFEEWPESRDRRPLCEIRKTTFTKLSRLDW